MVITLLSWLYILPLAYIYGLLGMDWSQRDAGRNAANQPTDLVLPFYGTILVGLSIISAITAYLYLVIKIGILAQAIILGIGGIYGVYRWRSPRQASTHRHRIKALGQLSVNRFLGLMILLLGLLLLLRASMGSFNFDTGLYHLQAIEWANRYAVTPGIANLHLRLGFNSRWLLLNALFNFSSLNIQPIYGLNCLLLLTALITALQSFRQILSTLFIRAKIIRAKARVVPIDWQTVFQALLLLPLGLMTNDTTLVAPSTDLPAAIAVFAIISLMLQYCQRDRSGHPTHQLGFLINILIVFAITIKLSTLPMGLFSVYIFWQTQRTRGFQDACWQAAPLLIGLIPHLVANVVMTGYLIFPLPSLDLFNPDWKVPLSSVISIKRAIESWARVPSNQVTVEAVLDHGMAIWIGPWFERIRTTPEFIGLVLCILSFCAYVGLQWRQAIAEIKPYFLVLSIAAIAVVYWFMVGPDIRFGQGLIWSVSLLLLTAVVRPSLAGLVPADPSGLGTPRRTKRRFAVPAWGTAIALLALLSGVTFGTITGVDRSGRSLSSLMFLETVKINPTLILTPVPFPPVSTQATLIGTHPVYAPIQGESCWAAAFPCVNSMPPHGEWKSSLGVARLQARGNSLGQGFRLVVAP